MRLESTGDRRVDYNVGLWYSDTETKTSVQQVAELSGAFGYPGVPQGPANPDFLLGVDILIPTDSENTAVFGHLEFHVSDSLDIGMGARYLEEKSTRAQTLATGSALNAVDMRAYGLTEPLIGIVCNAGLFPPPFATGQSYPNTCNAQVDASTQATALQARIAANKRDFEARFALAQHHMAHNRWTEAMDELLDILMRDKSWNDDLARKTYIAILDVIDPPKPKVAEGQVPPEDPTVATYRRRLSSVVLS